MRDSEPFVEATDLDSARRWPPLAGALILDLERPKRGPRKSIEVMVWRKTWGRAQHIQSKTKH